jgi:hypothetical protein
VEDISALERASIEPIERNGIVDQDAISDRLVRAHQPGGRTGRSPAERALDRLGDRPLNAKQ